MVKLPYLKIHVISKVGAGIALMCFDTFFWYIKYHGRSSITAVISQFFGVFELFGTSEKSTITASCWYQNFRGYDIPVS